MSFQLDTSSSIYVLLTLHLYYIVKCKAGDAVFGISENGSFKKSFDEAVRNLNISTPNNFLRMNHNQGLNHWIETGVRLISTLDTSNKDNMFYFSDVNDVENGIIEEIMEFQSRKLTNRNRKIYVDNGFSERSKVSIKQLRKCLFIFKSYCLANFLPFIKQSTTL